MNELLNGLFGLGNDKGGLGFGSAQSELSFVHPLPMWGMVAGACLIVLVVWWSYRATVGSLKARVLMGLMRVMTMMILFMLALGPMIEQSTIHTEQDWAMILLDRSGSMNTRDAKSILSNRVLVSRDEQLVEMLDNAGGSWEEMASSKRVVWMSIAEQAREIGIGDVPGIDALPTLDGHGTHLGAAIQAAMDVSATRPVSSIVLVSDGRSFDSIDTEILTTLAGSHVPVFVVPMGSEQAIEDIGIARVEYPRAVFADDMMPMRVLLSSTGIDEEQLILQKYRVELRDHATGSLLSSAPILSEHLRIDGQARQAGTWVTLSHTPETIGEQEYDIVISRGEARNDIDDSVDLNTTNNQQSAKVRVVDRPMRVLYVDGYPRWEHRYLKNLLLRERSISSSSMLLASTRRYVQEGDELITQLPTTLEEWEPFDVVILGDVRAELFTDQQLESLLEHVTVHGAGVLWIAGPSAMPSSWIDSPLAALLPIRRDAGGSQSAYTPWDSPVVMHSTPEADRLGLLGLNNDRTGWLDRLSEPSTGWSKLQWAQMLDETSLKPGVTVLAYAQGVDSIDASNDIEQGAPVITSLRAGSGRSVYVGTDEIWRWRYGRGEDLPERFWLPIIRSLGRGTIDRRAAPASLSISPTNPLPNKPTQITLRLFDQTLIDSTAEEIQLEITSASIHNEPETLTLRGIGDTRVGTWIPEQPGSFTASPMGSNLAISAIETHVRVLDISDEQRLLDTDHDFLARLAEQTGGQVIAAADFNSIPSLMPNRMRTISSPPVQASLWDRPVVLIVLVLLLSMEWIGRRILRLA